MFFSVFATSLTLKTYDFYGFSYVSSLEHVCSARACSASVRSLKSTGASGADTPRHLVMLFRNIARSCKTRLAQEEAACSLKSASASATDTPCRLVML